MLLGQKLMRVVAWTDAEPGGRTAEEWRDSYVYLREAIDQCLEQFLRDGEEAEEWLYVETIKRVGFALRNVRHNPEAEGWGWEGTIDLNDFVGDIPARRKEDEG